MPDATNERMQLTGSVRGDAVFTLALSPEKPRLVFGHDGVSRKGADATAASYYITFTRLAARGTLRLGGRDIPVHGRAWMDHEISSSQLGEKQVGWDWCSLQLNDGWDLMSYRLRRDDGSSDPFSTLAWVSPEGKIIALDAKDFSWEPLETWTSPATGGRYPIRYRLHARSPRDGRPLVLEVRALAPNQELTGSLGGIAYWEGACDVFDESGRAIGRGYTELTGYASSLQGKL
jgi:predicted secreted hydrolase